MYYLDWLHVIATRGVFLFHASNVFNTATFEIKNAEGSETITIIDVFFYPWGMPLFFLVADAEWIADLRRHGLLRGSFIPSALLRELRDLTRYRARLGDERTSEVKLHR